MDRRIQLTIALLEQCVSAPPTTAELARAVNLSTSRLRHIFKTETGKTPAQYLKNLRMLKAELLLRTTFLSVKEIINRVGLTNGSNFVREFKKIYGIPPTKYRVAVGQEPWLRRRKTP